MHFQSGHRRPPQYSISDFLPQQRMYAEYSAYYAAPPPPPFGLGLGQKYAWAPFETYSNSGVPTSIINSPATRSPRRSSRRNSDPTAGYSPPPQGLAIPVVVPPQRSSSHHQGSKRVHFAEDQSAATPSTRHHSRRHSTGRTFAEYFDSYKEREHSARRRKRSSRSAQDAPPTVIPVVQPPVLQRTHRYGYPLPPQTQPVNIEIKPFFNTSERRKSSRINSATGNTSAPTGGYGFGQPFVSSTPFAVPVTVNAPEPAPQRKSSRRSARSARAHEHAQQQQPGMPQQTAGGRRSHRHASSRSTKTPSEASAPRHGNPSAAPANTGPVESLYYLGSPKTVPLFVKQQDTRFRKREALQQLYNQTQAQPPQHHHRRHRDGGRGEERERERRRDRERDKKSLPPGRGLRRMKNFFFGW